MSDWYGQTSKLITSMIAGILAIDERAKHPDRDNWGQEQPDMPADERLRLAYYDAADRARLAGVCGQLAKLADWDAVVATELASAERRRSASRAAYEERMASSSQPMDGRVEP